ncbi:sugar ABC transporter ATP-binding protein [Glaciibacter sp. 2TAF33]|uniref:sugar ABC transporter ATP-binding protein n=1 Tax=Glaciibacter sp. 2TAF33 TaxID=3233015 RepID=UPI003F91DB16
MGKPILVAENLSIAFGGVTALENINLTIGEGEILCLAGENGCGKSTFVKIVSGVYVPGSGTVTIDGTRVDHQGPRAAIGAGVQVIYQDLSLFDHLTVAENIAMNRMMHDGSRFVNARAMRAIAAEQLARVGVELPLDDRVSTLSVANKQLVAIARALSMDARILFMDEPTTSLTTNEVKRLLEIVLELKKRGLSIVFISHKLDEVFAIADNITIFRDGRKVGDFTAAELDEESLSFHMTGRRVSYARYHRQESDNAPLLEVKGLGRTGNYADVSFDVRKGDILGLTGLLGAGRTEIALSLFGLNPPDSGQVLVGGRLVTIGSPWEAMDLGIALVPEDRKTQGLFGAQSIRTNVSSNGLESVRTRAGLIDGTAERALAQATVNEMNVNNKNIDTLVENLSGGNQQKVVIGKWIARKPTVFILDSPTVGIDIGSKQEIYDRIHALAASGIGVILISDEPEEIIANCNRVIVMHEGAVLDSFEENDLRAPEFKERLATIIGDPTAHVKHAPAALATAATGGEQR